MGASRSVVMRVRGMRLGITITLVPSDRCRLEAIASDRNTPQKHVWRAAIVLLSADGVGTVEIMRRTGTSMTCIWRWQERFVAAGVEGLPRDKTRPSRVPPLVQTIIDRVVAMTATEPPHEATHGTAAAMAKVVGISVSFVQRIWKAHGLAPHRLRQFKLSRDPDVVPKLRDVVGLYVDPPAHAVVLSVDEKSQIQALDRTAVRRDLRRWCAQGSVERMHRVHEILLRMLLAVAAQERSLSQQREPGRGEVQPLIDAGRCAHQSAAHEPLRPSEKVPLGRGCACDLRGEPRARRGADADNLDGLSRGAVCANRDHQDDEQLTDHGVSSSWLWWAGSSGRQTRPLQTISTRSGTGPRQVTS